MRQDAVPGVGLALKQLLFRNTAWNYLGFAANLVTGFLLFPFVVGAVGESAAGVWLLLASVTGYMGLLELGIVPALAQYTAAHLASGDRTGIEGAASTAMMLLVCMMGLALQLVWLVPYLVDLLHAPTELRGDAVLLFSIAIAGFAGRMPLAVFQALLLGYQRQDRCNQLWIGMTLAKAGLSVGLILLGFGIVAIVTMEAAVHLAAGVFQVRWVRAENPSLRLSWASASWSHAVGLLTLGATLLANGVCSLIIEQSDRIVIGMFLPVAQVTHYSAAWKLYMLVYAVPTTLVQAVAPLAASLFGRGDLASLRALTVRMTRYTVLIAIGLAAAVSLPAGALLGLWMGPGFAQDRVVVQVLSVSLLVSSLNHCGYAVLVGMRRVGRLLWTYSLPQAVLNLALSLWLVGPLGIVGVALGTALAALVLEYAFLRHLVRQLELRWSEFLRDVLVPAVPASVTFVPLGAGYLALGPDNVWLPVVASVCCLLYVTVSWALLGDRERTDITLLVARLGRPLVARRSETSAPTV
jgi:O-antigen/teichoic acid export membrane protein